MSATGPAESCRCGCNVILMSQQRHGIWPLLICLPCLSGAAVAAPSREDRNSLREGRPFASRLYRHKDEPPPAQPSTVSGIQLNSTEVGGSWNTQDSRDGRPRQSSSTGPSLSSKDAVSPGPRLQPWKAVCQPTLRRRPSPVDFMQRFVGTGSMLGITLCTTTSKGIGESTCPSGSAVVVSPSLCPCGAETVDTMNTNP